MKTTLKQFLLAHINQSNSWCGKGELYMVGEQEGYSPENVGRTLRLMAEVINS